MQKEEIPIYSDDAINERYYGKLQGLNKQAMREKYGEEQVHLWRRSFDIRPPGGESLKDTCRRSVPYFVHHIMPYIRNGKHILIAAHGNSLRAIIKHIDNISDEKIPNLELPTGKPIIYKLTNDKLRRQKHLHTFTRPTHWHHKHKPSKKKRRN